MKTVSTKLDNNLHNRFVEICNEDGKCQSEFLRDLIETVCEDLGMEEGFAVCDTGGVDDGVVVRIGVDFSWRVFAC